MIPGITAAGGLVNEPPAVGLLAALRAWWAFEQNGTGSTFNDSHGSNHLTLIWGPGNDWTQNVTAAGGIAGRQYAPANEDDTTLYCPRSNTALDLPNSDFSFGGWFKADRQGGGSAAFIMGRIGNGSGNAIQAYLSIDGTTGELQARASTDGSSGALVSTTGYAGLTNTEWQLIVLTFNRTANTLELRHRRPGANGGAMHFASIAFPGALFTGSTAANFTIGDALQSDNSFFSGSRNGVEAADECFFADKAISDAEFAYLYNGGAGRSYADLVADAA